MKWKARIFSEDFRTDFRRFFEKSLINMPFDVYWSRLTKFPLLVYGMSLVIFTAIHYLILGYGLVLSILLALILSSVGGLVTLFAFLYYPSYRIKSRAASIEAGLVYTIGFMSALANAGMDVTRIIEKTIEVEDNKDIKRELLLLLRDIKILGIDVVTAINNAIKRSASRSFEEYLEGVRETVLISGDLREYISFVMNRLIEDKRRSLMDIVNSLSFISEIYITLMVAAPMIFTILFSLMSILGGGIMGINPLLLLIFYTFIMVPLSSLAVIIIIDAWLSKV